MVDADCIVQCVTKQYDGECDEENRLQDHIMYFLFFIPSLNCLLGFAEHWFHLLPST